MNKFLAWIIPLSQEAHPEHPIVLPPDQPPTIWPSPGVPTHPNYYPPTPTHPIYYPTVPTHPIVIPPEPPSGGTGPVYPSHPIYWPPVPTHPIYWPTVPTHPIVLPPQPPSGGGSGGGEGGTVENPINRPPSDDPRWLQVYVPGLGWVWALVPPEGHKPQVNPLAEEKPAEE
jgi:hypothetical protein